MAESVFDPKADSSLPDEELAHLKERYAGFDARTEVPRIVRETFGAEAISFAPLEKTANAFDHLVYRAEVEQGSETLPLVVRINASSAAEEMFMTETAVYDLLAERGLRAPKVYATTLRNSDRAYDYQVMERIGSGSLESLRAHAPHDADEYARAAGAYLAALHTIELPGFGMLTHAPELRGVESSWRAAIITRLTETLGYLTEQELLSVEEAFAVQHAFEWSAEILDSRHEGRFLHGDYHPANILVDERDGSVAGAVDLSQAKVGDPLFDLAFFATYLDAPTFDAVLAGYGKTFTDTEKRALALYSLRIYLSKAKLRKRFGYTERIPAALAGIRQALAELG